MNLLVLGGTVFVGRHFVESALANGHRVTLVHRGQRGTQLFPEAERIIADRDGGLGVLGDRHWDAVVDCCGYVPRVVRQSAEALRRQVGRYLFVSTISVYSNSLTPDQDEGATLFEEADAAVEEVVGATYGPLKVGCERVVSALFNSRALIVRPGLVIGPYDPTNRFTYWVDRLARGGTALVPARPEQPLQLVDARDLARFMLAALEQELDGAYNATGEQKTFGEMIQTCHRANFGTQLIWVDPAILGQHEVALWAELPLALPPDGSDDGMMRISNARALAKGLQLRTWQQSAEDVLEWTRKEPSAAPPRHGLDPDKEARIIAAMISPEAGS